MEHKDEQLMLNYQQTGDKEAIAMIYERYKSQVLNFSLRMLGNRAQAEDAAGEVFLALFSSKYKFHPEAKFSTWLFTIARNQCISQRRKNKGLVSLFKFQDADPKPLTTLADGRGAHKWGAGSEGHEYSIRYRAPQRVGLYGRGCAATAPNSHSTTLSMWQ